MDLLKKLHLTPLLVLKLGLAVIVALIVLLFAFELIGSSFGTIARQVNGTAGVSMPGYGVGGGYSTASYDSSYTKTEDAIMPEISARNASTIPPYPQQGSTGNTAEKFEVTQYSATIETRHLEDTCDTVAGLKAREDVIFENSNTQDRGCSFIFKVEKGSVEEVLVFIQALDPKELSNNTYTIKGQVDDFTSETEVLTKKRASIDETLASALSAYNEITRLATNTQNADALAKIIDSKIGIIERLTQERININEQLDRLARAKADQLDGLEYTRFSVNVYENKFVDGEGLRDSWKQAIKNFVYDLNKIVQDLTIGLVLLLVFIAQWMLYALIVLVLAKYGWKLATYIWKR